MPSIITTQRGVIAVNAAAFVSIMALFGANFIYSIADEKFFYPTKLTRLSLLGYTVSSFSLVVKSRREGFDVDTRTTPREASFASILAIAIAILFWSLVFNEEVKHRDQSLPYPVYVLKEMVPHGLPALPLLVRSWALEETTGLSFCPPSWNNFKAFAKFILPVTIFLIIYDLCVALPMSFFDLSPYKQLTDYKNQPLFALGVIGLVSTVIPAMAALLFMVLVDYLPKGVGRAVSYCPSCVFRAGDGDRALLGGVEQGDANNEAADTGKCCIVS